MIHVNWLAFFIALAAAAFLFAVCEFLRPTSTVQTVLMVILVIAWALYLAVTPS